MIDETSTPETDELALPDFLDRASPEVIAIVKAGRQLTLDQRKAELAKATAPATVKCEPRTEPKPGSATAMAAKPAEKPEQAITKPAKVIDVPAPKAKVIVAGKKADAEMIKLIKEHREFAGGTAGKTLKLLREQHGVSCSQERFKKLYAAAA